MTEPTVHELNIAPRWFDAVARGTKPFEVRRDDRGYAVGDVLLLREFAGYSGEWVSGLYCMEPQYTGRSCRRTVTYVLRHEDFPAGVPEGYCVLGIQEEATADE